VTEDLSRRLIRLPLYYDLSEIDQARVVQEIDRFSRQGGRVPAGAAA